MVAIDLFGKEDLLEKIAWCKKYSSSQDEEERLNSASIILKLATKVMAAAVDPARDVNKVAPQLKELGLTFPNAEELNLFNEKLIKNIGLGVLFDQVETIPGKPDFEFGIGFVIETHFIFFEEILHKEVDVVQVKKKMGLFKEKVTTKEKKLKSAGELLGEKFSGEEFTCAVTGREKDNRDRIRYGVRFSKNLFFPSKDKFFPDKLTYTWKNEEQFFKDLINGMLELQEILNKIYTMVGYETIPDYNLLLGEVTVERKIQNFTKEEMHNGLVIGVTYE